jgi:deoxyribodipyrimidine photolyase-related protein
MTLLRLILCDQLSENISSLIKADKEKDIIMIAEVMEEATYVKHHKKKLVFLFSAMRHFAIFLKALGFKVHYIKIDDSDNAGSLEGELGKAISRFNISKIIVTHPGEYRLLKKIKNWNMLFDVDVEIKEDNRFLCSINNFKDWSKGKTQLRMEFFYREMRKKYNILMEGEVPFGGKWNYDSENRKIPDHRTIIPCPYKSKLDEVTQEVMQVVKGMFHSHFGDIEPFNYAVTRKDALKVLDHFINNSLSKFGDYQDAMLEGEPFMFHSHISFYLNCGLLDPLECVLAAENAYHSKLASLNSVEGFIRQVIGWREFIRGIYWLKMPGYSEENFFQANKELPEFYWTANTDMNCLKQCIKETKENAYAHHIQRLMVLGNFALLTGVDPSQVNEWFLIVYADAYEWVELPNVTGMSLFADGGFFASKPYAAGGSYINKMSNYCKSCKYDVSKKSGPDACPFNYLYWNFLLKNKDKLDKNPRIALTYKTLDKMEEIKKENIIKDSIRFLGSI